MEKNITLKQLYDEIVKNRNEIKSLIQAIETKLQSKVGELEDVVTKLNTENQDLRSEIEEMKRNGKKNNIVTYGLYKRGESFSCSQLCQKLNNLISTSLVEKDIQNFYFLGKSENCPLKIELSGFRVKLDILANKKKLKGQNVTIVNDLTQTQQSEQKILRKYLLIAKRKGQNCYIRKNKLYVEDEMYTVEELQDKENQQEDSDRISTSSSSPATPAETRSCEEFPLNQQEIPSPGRKGATRKIFAKATKPITRAQEKRVCNK